MFLANADIFTASALIVSISQKVNTPFREEIGESHVSTLSNFVLLKVKGMIV